MVSYLDFTSFHQRTVELLPGSLCVCARLECYKTEALRSRGGSWEEKRKRLSFDGARCRSQIQHESRVWTHLLVQWCLTRICFIFQIILAHTSFNQLHDTRMVFQNVLMSCWLLCLPSAVQLIPKHLNLV